MAREVIVTDSGDTRDIFGAPDPHELEYREPGTYGAGTITGRCSCPWAITLLAPSPGYPSSDAARKELQRRHAAHAIEEFDTRAEQDRARAGPFSMDPQLKANEVHTPRLEGELAVREPAASAPGLEVTLCNESGPIAIFLKGYPSRRGVNPIRLKQKVAEESVP